VGGAGGSDGSDGGLTPCGGITGQKCPSTSYCDYKPGDCGKPDASGVCQPRPRICPLFCASTCGCDGNHYCNACDAHAAGVDDSTILVCGDGGIGP
jgi:hypothetical protein